MNTPRQRKKSLPVALVAVMALVLTTACGDRPITDVSEEEDGRPVLHARTATGNFLRTRGDVGLEDIVIANFDASVPDAFARATGEAHRYFEGCCYAFDNPTVAGSDQDFRTPALQGESFGSLDLGSGAFFYVLGPEFWGGPVFDWWGGYSGVPAETRIWLGLARYGVNVNDGLDQEDVLTGHPSTADQLVLQGGTPGGDGDRPADQFNLAAPYPADGDANPYVFGHADSNEDGEVVFDVVTGSFDSEGNQEYYTGSFDASESPIGINENGSIDSDQYNYLVMYLDNPLTTANPRVLARIQVGADLQPGSFQTINNAFAPFPSTVADVENLGDLPGGGDAFAAPGTITLDGVGFMAGPTFEVGVYSRDDGTFTPVESEVVITDTIVVDPIEGIVDTVSVDVLEGVTTFSSPRAGAIVEITMSGADFGANSHVVVRLSGVEGSDFLYREYLTESLSLTAGPTAFGEFNPGGTNRVYTLEGQGELRFFGDSALVELSRITPEPPAGFHYQSYLISGDGNVQRVHAVELDARGNGQDRIGVDEIEGDFADYNLWVLATEPDGSTLTADGVRTLQTQVSEDYFSKFADFFSR